MGISLWMGGLHSIHFLHACLGGLAPHIGHHVSFRFHWIERRVVKPQVGKSKASFGINNLICSSRSRDIFERFGGIHFGLSSVVPVVHLISFYDRILRYIRTGSMAHFPIRQSGKCESTTSHPSCPDMVQTNLFDTSFSDLLRVLFCCL